MHNLGKKIEKKKKIISQSESSIYSVLFLFPQFLFSAEFLTGEKKKMGKVPRESSLIFFSRVPQRGSAPKKKCICIC